MGAYVQQRARTSGRVEPALPRVMRHLEMGCWLLTIVGALVGAYSLYAHLGLHENEQIGSLVYAMALSVIPYVLARSIAALRRGLS